MSSPTAGEVLRYLSGIASGTSSGVPSPLYPELARRGAVSGAPEHPELTAVGQHVLKELRVRAYRADALALDQLSEEIGGALTELDEVARVAAYFLAELGPVSPPETLPLMRISAAGLANRRSSPEELAEAFRNTWGMVEVMEGDSRDRLLAAELLVRSPVPVSRLYAAIMHTMEELRQPAGRAREPISTATLLHLYPAPSPQGRMAEWRRWRPLVHSDEVAAFLAGGSSPTLEANFSRLRTLLAEAGASATDAEEAATYLALAARDPAGLTERVRSTGAALAERLPAPYLAAALLAARHDLSAEELVDWVEKAAEVAKARRIAPTPGELFAIGVSLVHGLSPSRFATPAGRPPGANGNGEELGEALLALTALHAWLYRPLLLPSRVPAQAGA